MLQNIMSSRLLCVGAAILLYCAVTGAAEEPVGEQSVKELVEQAELDLDNKITPDQPLQEAIDHTAEAFTAIGDDFAGVADAYRRLLALKRMAGTDRRLVPQLVYYEAKEPDIRKRMMIYIIFARGEVSPESIATGLAPYISEPNLTVRKRVHRRLRMTENASPGRKPDFDHYYGVIREYALAEQEQLMLPLISYLYESDPGEAMLIMMQVLLRDNLEQMRQITWAEHVIADVLWKHEHKFSEPDRVDAPARQELEKLARSKHWWVRLYVAEIMRQHPGFRQPELIDRLKKDEHRLVRKAMSFGEGPLPEKVIR